MRSLFRPKQSKAQKALEASQARQTQRAAEETAKLEAERDELRISGMGNGRRRALAFAMTGDSGLLQTLGA